MKKITAACGFLIFFAACNSGQIVFKKDDFKGVTVATMELSRGSDESLLEYSRIESEFSRKIKNGLASPAVISFKTTRGVDSSDMTSDAFIKIDDKTVKIKISGMSGEILTQINTQTTETYNANPSGYVDFTQQPGVSQQTSAQSFKIFSGKINFDSEIEKTILNAKQMVIRLYFGTSTGTYTFKGQDLEKIKKFLVAFPSSARK